MQSFSIDYITGFVTDFINRSLLVIPQGILDPPAKVISLERLDYIVENPKLGALHDRRLILPGGEHDHRNVFALLHPADLLQRLDPAFLRHLYIHEPW